MADRDSELFSMEPTLFMPERNRTVRSSYGVNCSILSSLSGSFRICLNDNRAKLLACQSDRVQHAHTHVACQFYDSPGAANRTRCSNAPAIESEWHAQFSVLVFFFLFFFQTGPSRFRYTHATRRDRYRHAGFFLERNSFRTP